MNYHQRLGKLETIYLKLKQRWIPTIVHQLTVFYSFPLDILVALIFWPVFGLSICLILCVRFVVQLILYLPPYNKKKLRLVSGADSLFGHQIPNNSPLIHGISIIKGAPDLKKIQERYENVVFTYRGDRNVNTEGKFIYSKLKKIFTYRLGFYCWEDFSANFNIEDHVKYLDSSYYCLHLNKTKNGLLSKVHVQNQSQTRTNIEETVSEAQLMEILSQLMNKTLPDSRPQWEQLIVPNFKFNNEDPSSKSQHYVAINRIHHGYADGASLGMFMDCVMADEPIKFFLHPLKPFPGMTNLIEFLATCKTVVNGPSDFLRSLNSAVRDNSRFRVLPYSSSKVLDWTEPIDMNILKNIKKRSNASIPSILLSAITSALAKAHVEKFSTNCKDDDEDVPKSINIGSMSVMLPYPNQGLQNHFTTLPLPCPLRGNCAIERLKKTDLACKTKSFSSEPKFNFIVMRSLGYFPRLVQDFVMEFAGTPILFSNVPGVTEPAKIFNSELVDTGVWLPLLRVVGLGIATYSYCGKLRICVTSESKIFPKNEQLQCFLGDVLKGIEDLAIAYKIPFDSNFLQKSTKDAQLYRFNTEKG